MTTNATERARRLRQLINRTDKVAAVMHPPNTTLARIMEKAGFELGFIGGTLTVGGYTGLSGLAGTATSTETLQVAGWIARSVSFPCIVDGDTDYGGIMAVRRLVADCINAGLAGIRFDDEPLESKRRGDEAYRHVLPLKHAVARFRAAVDMRDELDPEFVIMTTCHARTAEGGTLEKAIARMKAYKEEAGVDMPQFFGGQSLDEIRAVRKAIPGPLSFLLSKPKSYMSLKQHLELGYPIAWYPPMTHHVIRSALWDFMQDFNDREIVAWEEFLASRKDKPYPPLGASIEADWDVEGAKKQAELEQKYFSPAALEKLRKYE